MKLEFLDDISNGGQFKDVVSDNLVHLYDFDEVEAAILRNSVLSSVIQNKQELNLSNTDFLIGLVASPAEVQCRQVTIWSVCLGLVTMLV